MRILAAVAASALLFACSACSRADRTATDEPVSTTTLTSAPMVTRPWTESPRGELEQRHAATNQVDIDPVDTDETVSFRLQLGLLTEPEVANDADDVSIDVKQGVVTLGGRATRPETRAAMQRVATGTVGVVHVDNRVVVRPGT